MVNVVLFDSLPSRVERTQEITLVDDYPIKVTFSNGNNGFYNRYGSALNLVYHYTIKVSIYCLKNFAKEFVPKLKTLGFSYDCNLDWIEANGIYIHFQLFYGQEVKKAYMENLLKEMLEKHTWLKFQRKEGFALQ